MQAMDPHAPGPSGPSRSRGVAGLFRGAFAALRGMRAALGNRDVFRVYGRLTLALMVTSLLLGGLMVYGVYALADAVGDGSWGAGADGGLLDGALDVLSETGRVAVLIVGIILAVVAAPVLSVLVLGLLFPVFAEAVFFAGLRPLDRARADELEARPGLSLAASIAVVVRVLLRFVGLTLVAFAVGLIPIIGTVLGPVMSIWVASQTLGWELLDPYFGKRSMGYRAQKQYVKAHGGGVLGFGLPLSFLLAVPLIGPLFFGLAQAAAPTLLVDVLEP